MLIWHRFMWQDFTRGLAVAVVDWPYHIILLLSFNKLIPNRRFLKSVTTSQALPEVICTYLEVCCLGKLRNLQNRECICSLNLVRFWKSITLMYQNHTKHSNWILKNTQAGKVGALGCFLCCSADPLQSSNLSKPQGLTFRWALAQSIPNGKCSACPFVNTAFLAMITWFYWKAKLKLQAWSRFWVLIGVK